MPTVIDSLVVSLGLDPKDFKKGEKEYLESLRKMEEESKKSNESMQKDTTNLSDAVGFMTNRVLGLATAFLSAGAAQSFVSGITKSDAAVGRLAENIGSTSEELSLWQGIVKRVGGDSAAVAKSFEGIARSLEQWQLYGIYPDAFKLFEVNNIALIDKATGKQRTFTDLMIETSKVIQGMDKARAMEVGYGMGLDRDLINILKQGPVATMKYITEQRGVVSSESAKLAQERQDSEAKVTAALTELGRNIVDDLSPIIKSFNKNLSENVEGFNEIMGGHPFRALRILLTPFSSTEVDDATLTGNLGRSNTGLGALIRQLESGGNYGAINIDKSNVADRQELKKAFSAGYSSKSLSDVISEEIAGKYQAAGAYQIRASTLSDAIESMGLSGNEKFSKEMQDRIFNEFLMPRRMKGSSEESLKGLINEFDALRGHESETMQLLSQVNPGGITSNSSSSNDTVFNIGEVNVSSSANNINDLGKDLRETASRNYKFTAQANSSY